MSHDYQAAIDAARERVRALMIKDGTYFNERQRALPPADIVLDTYRDLVAAVARYEAADDAHESDTYALLQDAKADADQQARAVLGMTGAHDHRSQR